MLSIFSVFLKGKYVKVAVVGVVCLTLIAAAYQLMLRKPSSSLAVQARPNIIFVMTDDLGYGDIAPLGQTRFETPALSRMAEEGLMLISFYSGSTVCAPARRSLMRGRHTGKISDHRNSQVPLKRSHVTVAEYLGHAEYTTAIIGKWAMGLPGSTGVPNRQGFDYSFGFLDQGAAHRHYPVTMVKNGEEIGYPGNEGESGRTFSNDEFRREAVEFIRAQKGTPFFLYLPLTLPHADITAPQATMDEFAGRYPDAPFVGSRYYVAQPTPNAAYAAMVTEIDRTMAEIIKTLEETGLEERTLVIFTSDNGPAIAGGRNPEFFNSSAGFRGGKRDLYEGGIRVPFIAWWPGTIPSGTRSEVPASFEDVFPTFAEMAGLPAPQTTTGRSILPILLDPKQSLPDRRLYWIYEGRDYIMKPDGTRDWAPGTILKEAYRLGNWKLLRFNRGERVELYDLASDPAETEDLSQFHPERVNSMLKGMNSEYDPG